MSGPAKASYTDMILARVHAAWMLGRPVDAARFPAKCPHPEADRRFTDDGVYKVWHCEACRLVLDVAHSAENPLRVVFGDEYWDGFE